jgi:hypothetical protein
LRNIDKSMIGLPTNFQHCAHIGCSDLSTGSISVSGNVANSSVTGLMQPNIHRVRFKLFNGKLQQKFREWLDQITIII